MELTESSTHPQHTTKITTALYHVMIRGGTSVPGTLAPQGDITIPVLTTCGWVEFGLDGSLDANAICQSRDLLLGSDQQRIKLSTGETSLDWLIFLEKIKSK